MLQVNTGRIRICLKKTRDEDPDPVGSVDVWPAGSRFVTFASDPDPT